MATEITEIKLDKKISPLAPEHTGEKPALTELAEFLNRTHAFLPMLIMGIFLMGLIAGIYFARPFLMPVILAVLLNYLLRPVVRWLAKIRIGEKIGAFMVLLVFFTIAGFGISRLAQPASDWIASAPQTFRTAEGKIRHLLRPAAQFSKAAEKVEDLANGATAATESTNVTAPADSRAETTTVVEKPAKPTVVEVKQTHLAGDLLVYTKSFLAGALETIVLLYFLLASGDMFMQKLIKILPTMQDKQKAIEIGHELQSNISTFLFTITVINSCLGLLVGIGVKLVGMPNPVLWGVVAGLLNFIPYFGPITGVIVLLVAGLVTFESAGEALVPPLIYLTLHALESNVLTPMILGKRLTLNPVMIFISLIFWTWLWGISGALLSVPMLMMLKIFCDHFKPLASVGEFLGE